MTVPIIAGGACAATFAGSWAALRLWDGHRNPGTPFPLEISHDEYARKLPNQPRNAANTPTLHRRAATWYRRARYRRRLAGAWDELQAATERWHARPSPSPLAVADCWEIVLAWVIANAQPAAPLYDQAAWDAYVKGAA